MMDSRYGIACHIIADLHRTFPADISFKDRKKAVSDAYPWGERKYHPYKAWLRAQRKYLARYSDKPAGPLAPVPAITGGGHDH